MGNEAPGRGRTVRAIEAHRATHTNGGSVKKFTKLVVVGDDGALPGDTAACMHDYIGMYSGRKLEISMGSPKRSSGANRFYYGYRIAPIVKAVTEAGMRLTTGALHRHFKNKYLPKPEPEELPGGKFIDIEPSTANMDGALFYWYMEAIRMDDLVHQLGIHLPSSDWYEERHGKISSYGIAG